jgi:hypothetical protein
LQVGVRHEAILLFHLLQLLLPPPPPSSSESSFESLPPSLTHILSLFLLRVLSCILPFLLLHFYLHISFYTFFSLSACSTSPRLLPSLPLYTTVR